MVIVMNTPTSARKAPDFLMLDEAMFSGVCEKVMLAIACERDRRLHALAQLVQTQRKAVTGWRKVFRGSIEMDKIRKELTEASPLSDARWLQQNMELKNFELAAKRVLFNASWLNEQVQVPQKEWALVLRAYKKFVK